MIALTPKSRILIVLMGSIGDVIRALPLAHAIKTALPQSFLGWMVETKSYELIKENPYIDRVYLFDRSEGLSGFYSILKELRADRFEVTLDLQRHFKSGLASFFSGSAVRLGFNRKNCKELNYLFNNHQIDFRPDSYSKLQHYLDFMRFLGIAVPDRLNYGLDIYRQKDAGFTAQFATLKATGRPVIGLVVGSSWKSKDWLPPGYLNLARILIKTHGATIVLLGDRSKIKIASEISHTLKMELGSDPESHVLNFTGATDLPQLCQILSLLTLGIGPDSGPGHLCAAYDVPYITLFGPTSPDRVAPHGMEELAVRSPVGCSPCWRKECPGLKTICMRLISPEAVAAKALSILRAEQV